MNRRNYQEAIEILKKAISNNRDCYAYFGLATAYAKINRYKEAIQSSKEANSIKEKSRVIKFVG